MKIAVALVTLAAAIAATGCTTPEVSLQTECEAESSGSADATISACTAAIESGSLAGEQLMQVYRRRALLYFKRGDDERAIADFTEALEIKPDAASTLTLRGMAYSQKGDYDRAIGDFTRALELLPGFGMAAGGLEKAKEAKARIAAGQAIGDPRAWCEGKSLPQEGFGQDLQIQGCTTLIDSGNERRADLARHYFNRAHAYGFQGDRARAIADYGKAIALNSKNGDAYGYRGMIYWLEHEYARAIADFTAAIRLMPGTILFLKYRGESYFATAKFDAAIADFDRVLKLEPGNAEAYLHRSIARTAKGDYQRAIADADLAIRHSRTSEATEGYNARGNVHFHLSDWSTAIDDYARALEKWPEYPNALYGRGAAKIRKGDIKSGEADIAAAVKLKPDIAAIEAKLGIKP